MARCGCRGQHCGHCHYEHEDPRWAIPVLGVLLILAAAGVVREHGHSVMQAVQVLGYTVFGLSAAAVIILAAWRVRTRTRARRRSQVRVIGAAAWPDADITREIPRPGTPPALPHRDRDEGWRGRPG